jgi:SAM-dependent methyltransferase
MGNRGPAFYDDDLVFATYTARRHRPDNPNDTLELPVVLELVGEIAGRRILDLGCGDAAFGRYALDRGCREYVGVDGSCNMVAAARQTLEGTPGEVAHSTIEAWTYPEAAFDLVVSRLALHYIADVEAIFAQIYRTLIPGGRLVFSVEHPVITCCDRGWQTGQRQAWLVDNYFEIGPRETTWLGGRMLKYHRTVEAYFAALQRAGFVVESLRESHPRRAPFVDEEEHKRRKRIPLFLFLAGRKPPPSI